MKKFIRKILLSAFSAVLLLASVMGVLFTSSMQTKFASAEGAIPTGVFEMDDGASLKLGAVGGLRFIVRMDEDVYNFITDEGAELGFVIAPKNLMLAANGDYLNMPKKIGGAVDKNKIYQDGSYYFANGCITNVKAANLTRSFTAVAYIKYGDEVRYTEYNDLARNSLYDTVNSAVLSGKYTNELFTEKAGGYVQSGENEGWYGSEEYPIVVESDAEYSVFMDAVNKATEVNFSDYNVVIKNNAETDKVFVNTEYAPIVKSERLDEVNKLIEALPDSVTMPDAIGMIGRIREVEDKYNALSESDKEKVVNYAKVESLLSIIEGYDRVYKNDATDGTVIPSYVPNYTSTAGGTATTRQDDVYGNVLTVTSDANGKAALHFQNFPSVEKYTKIYFYVKISTGCDIYLSDGITNDGWGADWKNTWSVSGLWCNADTWRLVTVPVSNGYIGTDFALGFRADTTGFTFEISDFYGVLSTSVATGLTFGNFTDSGETNEYGTVYNFTQGWSSNTDLGAFNAGALRGALSSGHDAMQFWIYNPNESDVVFYVNENETWIQTELATLTAKAWTEVVLTSAVIESNDKYLTYMCVRSGAGTAGWQISPMYSIISDVSYTDHADVKEVIVSINEIPDSITLADETTIATIRAAYEKLTAAQQGMVENYADLTATETTIAAIKAANAVVEMISAINANNLDETAVTAARAAYDALTDTAKGYVTNLAKLEEYEARLKAASDSQAAIDAVIEKITNLPDSVVMPDHLVFVSRIEAARDAYEALGDEQKGRVMNYAKLRTLISAIKGYETIHVQTVDGVEVIPSHVPNYTSTIGGTVTMGYDSYYGNYLKVTPNAGGKVAIQFKNFPDVSAFEKIYFNIRVVGASCDIYLSDGITNDGWGDGWHNTWSTDGFWTNNGNWIQKEVAVSTGIFSSNWALGLRTNTTGVSFEITNIVGVKPDLGEATDASFGNVSDSGTKNIYGTVYNLTQGWGSETDLGAFNVGILNSALKEGHDSLRFYIYNPNENDVVFYVNENETWIQTELATLTAKAWTEVVLTPAVIESNNKYLTYMCVRSGAKTSGWQISPIYSFSLGDVVDKVQARINALDTQAPDEYKVQLAREAFEALTEVQKALVDTEKLIACETALYGNVTNAPFIVDGATQYKLYISGMDKASAAAAFANEQIKNATGVELTTVTDEPQNISKYRYAIVFGYWSVYSDLGGTKTADDITSRAGYVIERIGRTVFILANSADGYRMGALKFLNEVIGYDMIAEDCVVYDTSKAGALPEFNVIGEPFDYRQKQTYMTDTEPAGMGLQSNADIWIHSTKGWDMHNTLHYLPTANYQSAHPSWYYTYTDSVNVERTQICPTAGGSSSEFNAMVEAIAANMLVQINSQPEKENISFSIMDTGDNDDCQCTRCKLYDTLYGEGGFAAAWIDLMNAVNAKVRESLPADRVLNIAFLAYRGTEKAPANIDANGNVTLMKRYQINDDGSYTQTSEDLKCDEGVTVWLAPINGYFAENFNHADNAETLATIKKWCAISNSVYIWSYGTNFKFYMYPYNTWKASAENYKILKELGVKAVWSQSNETEATAFSDLKGYIDSKFMADVNADYETVLNNYFTNYFGAGSAKMRALFDKIVAKCEDIEANYDGLGRGIYDELENTSGFLGLGSKTYWEKSWLEECVTLCDEAKAAVDADTTLTDAQKTAIKNRITKESLFPRYVLCTTFASKYSTSAKKSMRQAFKADAMALGLTLYREANGLLSDLYSDWGI